MNHSIFFDIQIKNSFTSIEELLNTHRTQGTRSNLSIFDAALLMDLKAQGTVEVDPNVLRVSLN